MTVHHPETPTRRLLAIVPFRDSYLWSLNRPFTEAGFSIQDVQAYREAVPVDRALEWDVVAVMGGPQSAWDDEAHPYLADITRLLERRAAADAPSLGICLGGQLMARALGARLYKGPATEVGWIDLELTEAGAAWPVMQPWAAEQTAMFAWHNDAFDLPEGATLLARSSMYPHQAYRWGRTLLGVQFHPEVTEETVHSWVMGTKEHYPESYAELDVVKLEADTRRHAASLERQSHAAITAWLHDLGLDRPADVA